MNTPKVKIRQKNKSTFLFTFWIDGKRSKRITFSGTKREAELTAAHYQSEMLANKYEFLKKQKIISLPILIDEFLMYKKAEIRNSSLHRYENYLDPFKDFFYNFFPEACKDISLIKPAYILEVFNFFKENKQWKPKTLNGARVCLSAIFRHAMDEKYIVENPLRKLKKYKLEDKGKIKYYSNEELSLIFETIDPFWRDHIEFLYLTGLRKGELINLVWDNVDITDDREQIIIASNDGWKSKTGKSRIVPLNRKAVDILNKFKNKNKTYVFTNKKNGKILPDKPYHALKKALELLRLEGDIHKLRHTFAAHLVMKGVNIYDVSKLLGHTDIKTTEVYAHLAPEYLKKVVDIL